MDEIVPECFIIKPSDINVKTNNPFLHFLKDCFPHLNGDKIEDIEKILKLIILFCRRKDNYWRSFIVSDIEFLRNELRVEASLRAVYFREIISVGIIIMDKKEKRCCFSKEFIIKCHRESPAY